VKRYAAKEACIGLLGTVDYRLNLIWAVVNAGHQRGDQNTGFDAAAAELGYCVEAG